ncbi:hypothetical protein BG015_001018 [Linnemannia schmuckeri]|uniref:Uncharacterized protein n=1 Tax=Linnemannia schmuckeri TaxID=64567 RepID=A0A9P5RQU4_9FUNG|nr:hypothetical protein BG015_001018 [Linnemannia schmuckeri]
MADIQTQVVEETQEFIVVSENATATNTSTITATIITDTNNNEPALAPEVTEPAPIAPAPAPASAVVITEVKQQSRLSLAFKKISGGCGLCFSPLKSSPTDYHNLVETPTDEDEPHHLPGSHDNNGNASVPVVFTDDYKGEHRAEDEIVVASSSTDSHGYLHREEVHEEIKSRDLAVVEEFTTVMDEHNVIQEEEQPQEMEEVQFSTQIIDAPATFVEEIVENVVDDSTLPTAATMVEATPTPASAPEAVSLPATPAPTRSKTFSKLTRRSPSASVTTSSSNSPSSPSSPPSTSPLRERLGRFAKIIRPSETSSSIHSKVESLKVSTARSTPTVEDAVVSTVITAEPEQIMEKKTTVPLTPVSPVLKELAVLPLRSDTTPPLPPQPQQHNNRRNSLAVDTLVANNTTTTTTTTTTSSTHTTTTSTPVAIPSSWSNSPTTLHQHDISTTSGQSISRTGRASTMDSTTEVGSLSSNSNSNSNEQLSTIATSAPTGKDGLKANRRKSVMKKLGKIINTMNTNSRKNSMDKDRDSTTTTTTTKNEKRVSRQGSVALTSPLESEENLGF